MLHCFPLPVCCNALINPDSDALQAMCYFAEQGLACLQNMPMHAGNFKDPAYFGLLNKLTDLSWCSQILIIFFRVSPII